MGGQGSPGINKRMGGKVDKNEVKGGTQQSGGLQTVDYWLTLANVLVTKSNI